MSLSAERDAYGRLLQLLNDFGWTLARTIPSSVGLYMAVLERH